MWTSVERDPHNWRRTVVISAVVAGLLAACATVGAIVWSSRGFTNNAASNAAGSNVATTCGGLAKIAPAASAANATKGNANLSPLESRSGPVSFTMARADGEFLLASGDASGVLLGSSDRLLTFTSTYDRQSESTSATRVELIDTRGCRSICEVTSPADESWDGFGTIGERFVFTTGSRNIQNQSRKLETLGLLCDHQPVPASGDLAGNLLASAASAGPVSAVQLERSKSGKDRYALVTTAENGEMSVAEFEGRIVGVTPAGDRLVASDGSASEAKVVIDRISLDGSVHRLRYSTNWSIASAAVVEDKFVTSEFIDDADPRHPLRHFELVESDLATGVVVDRWQLGPSALSSGAWLGGISTCGDALAFEVVNHSSGLLDLSAGTISLFAFQSPGGSNDAIEADGARGAASLVVTHSPGVGATSFDPISGRVQVFKCHV